MSLQAYYDSLSPEEQALQFGLSGGDPLGHAFPRKRVVHAGLSGKIIAPAESQQIWQDVMSRRPAGREIQTAYIHIPFCKTKCLYCGFFQNGTEQEAEDEYVRCLVDELEQSADSPRLRDGLIHAVFIGGGTPTSLSPANADLLLKTIRRCLPLANDYELTLEGRIHDVVPEKMDIWFENGVNRVSLGVQSFDTAVRRSVGRLDDEETVLRRLDDVRAYNQAVIVIDLMYGLPGQTIDVWRRDLRLLTECAADGADLYQLNVFDGSDLNKAISEGRLERAAETSVQAQMFHEAKVYLEQRAYRRLNICHWSRTNRERSLYNVLARSGAAMFPFGSGAGGHVDGYETMLHRAISPYQMFVRQGQKPFMALMKQSPLRPLIDFVQVQMEQGYLDLNGLIAKDSRLGDLKWLYDLWQARGLVTDNGTLYMLTEAGQFWQVNLTQTTLECMQYLLTGESVMNLAAVAAQDSAKSEAMAAAMKKMKEKGVQPGMEAMKKMAEAMQHLSPEELSAVMKRMGSM